MKGRKKPTKSQPWKPSDATTVIRRIAAMDDFTLDLTGHARTQMRDRDLITGDVLHVLKFGYVYLDPEQATQRGCFRYQMESSAPSSSRAVRIVVIPWEDPPEIKVVTVMWRDEATQMG